MKFAISSHRDYYELTENKIVESLINSGIEPENIYFFIGGYEGFYEKVKNYQYRDKKYISLTHDLSMNMGSYRWDYLQERKDQILNYKNVSEDLQYYKQILINDEDIFFRPKEHHYNYNKRETSNAGDYYNNGTERIIEYFPGIDLHKIKANWCLKDIYTNKP